MPVSHRGLTFERLGHASVRMETDDGTVVYIDPWSQVLEGAPGDGDVVFSTHDDMDHYDPEAIDAVAGDDATVVVYDAIDTSDLDRQPTRLPPDETVTVDGIQVRSVPAYNRPDGEHVDEEGEPFHDVGEVAGLLLTVDEMTIYYPSDTDFLARHGDIRADVFIPPIGGHFTMDRHEAARFTGSVDPELVLPVHYDTFEQIETNAEAFVADVESEDRSVVLF